MFKSSVSLTSMGSVAPLTTPDITEAELQQHVLMKISNKFCNSKSCDNTSFEWLLDNYYYVIKS